MKRTLLIRISLLFIFLFSTACIPVDEKKIEELTTEIEKVDKQIKESQEELKKYGKGAALYNMTLLRTSVLQQTKVMLEQTKVSSQFFPKASYLINTENYLPPQNIDERISKLEKTIAISRDEWEIAQGKAEAATGLIAALTIMQAKTKGLTVSQLQYQLSAYKNGYPPLYPIINMPQNVPSLPKTSLKETTTEAMVKKEIAPSTEDLVLKEMKNAIQVTLLNKKYSKQKYKEGINFIFQYKNTSEKDIRAVTGITSFKDIFDREFLKVRLTIDDPIKSEEVKIDDSKGMEINKFKDDHQQLVNTEMRNLKMEFTPISIIFSDGTKIGSAIP